MGSEDLYLSHRGLIEQAITFVCRRQRLSAVDAEDFGGAVRLHLVADDYAVLRRFQHRSSLKTYLLAVITHHYQDWRNARWGKWRPSAEARRNGPLAEHLERLLVRDGLTFEEAYETLQTNFLINESRQTLERLAARFPVRSGRQFVGDDELESRPAVDSRADALLLDREAATAAVRAAATLRAALTALPPQDQLLLRMRFEDGFSIAEIARALALDQKPLYRRIEQILARLRTTIEHAGLTAADAADVLRGQGFDRLVEDAGEMRRDVRPFSRDDGSPAQNTRMP